MKRLAKMIVLFLLLGAIINVAVAWGCSLQPFVPYSVTGAHPGCTTKGSLEAMGLKSTNAKWSEDVRRLVLKQTGKPNVLAWFTDYVQFGTSRREIDVAVLSEAASRLRAGWPCYALQGERLIDWARWERDLEVNPGPFRDESNFFFRRYSIPLSFDRSKPHDAQRTLPLAPIWPGFAINTIFYAAILWLPVAGLGALRRRRRIKRGLCPACAYPVGTNPHCTECGKPVTR